MYRCSRDLDINRQAFSNFFAGRAKYPNFKKRHNGGSAEFTKSAINVEEWGSVSGKVRASIADSLESPTARGMHPDDYYSQA